MGHPAEDQTPDLPDTHHYVVRDDYGTLCGHKHRTHRTADRCRYRNQVAEYRATGYYQDADIEEHTAPGLPEFPEGYGITNNCTC